MTDKRAVIIRFVNWRHRELEHRIVPKRIFYGSSDYRCSSDHAKKQWLMEAFNLEKKADRTYVMSRIISWKTVDDE